MPRRVRKPCSQPGCSALTNGGPCDDHKRQRESQRDGTSSAYKTTRWQRIRKRFLYLNPWCLLCAQQACVADHWPVSRRDLVAKGEADPDAFKHLRPLCVSCHNQETARNQPGGFIAAQAKPAFRWPTPPPGG
jgi:5-methylcytosine-specific restriction protein A